MAHGFVRSETAAYLSHILKKNELNKLTFQQTVREAYKTSTALAKMRNKGFDIQETTDILHVG